VPKYTSISIGALMILIVGVATGYTLGARLARSKIDAVLFDAENRARYANLRTMEFVADGHSEQAYTIAEARVMTSLTIAHVGWGSSGTPGTDNRAFTEQVVEFYRRYPQRRANLGERYKLPLDVLLWVDGKP